VPTDEHDVDSLDEGWDSVEAKRHKTGAERAATRKAKAQARTERQRQKAAATAQKQKQKQKRARAAEDDDDEPARGKSHPPVRTAETERIAARRSWVRMFVAVGVIIAIAAFVMFVIVR
jgi:uncharacterized membrane protein YccC